MGLNSFLRSARERAGLTRPDVVARLKVSTTTVWKWENEGRPGPKHLLALAELYALDNDERAELMTLAGEKAA